MLVSDFLLKALSSYSFTFLIASSGILNRCRQYIINRTPYLQPKGYKHFIECRMCIGFWVSLIVCSNDLLMFPAVYGLSYFLATQER